MSGAPSTGLPSGFENKVLAFLWLMFFCFFMFMSCSFGITIGHIRSLEKVQQECTKHEDRKFVSVGNWLIAGSSEITVRSVCVEWIVRR